MGGGSGEGSGRQCQVRFNREVFPALGFAACFRKIGKNKMLRLLVIPPKLIVFFTNGCLGMRIPVRCVVSASYALPHAIQRPATARAAIDLCTVVHPKLLLFLAVRGLTWPVGTFQNT